jgi:hypothetical protein
LISEIVSHAAYPSHTGAVVRAEYFTCQLPEGTGGARYYIEAIDAKGNRSRSALERTFLGKGPGKIL